MRILLAAVNAKYIHSNLAVYSLKAAAGSYGGMVELAEYTINHEPDEIFRSIYRKRPELLFLSCYIWNRRVILETAANIRKVLPDAVIWAGGPEVSYDAEQFLLENPQFDGVMCGEGERTFRRLLAYYVDGCGTLAEIPGIAYRVHVDAVPEVVCSHDEIPGNMCRVHVDAVPGAACWRDEVPGNICRVHVNPPAAPMRSLDELPFFYGAPEYSEAFGNRIIYYESSRGCPFSCSYCLSSIDKSVRFRSLPLVEQELSFFLEARVPQVKFVDRTFNCNHAHAQAIWRYLLEHDNGVTNFHFEIAGDLLNEEELGLLAQMRPGLVQLEIGVQTTNVRALEAIHRKAEFSEIAERVRRIAKSRNVHQHLDLIAGLPYEDFESFQKSFDDVYRLHPQELQLGFLKVLRGSELHRRAQEYGIVSRGEPPYEVLQTRWITCGELLRLKEIEEMLEVWYNSGQFAYTIAALEPYFPRPFALYEALADYYKETGQEGRAWSRMQRFEFLRAFVRSVVAERSSVAPVLHYFDELLTLDLYLRENAKSRPVWAGDQGAYREQAAAFYRQEEQTRAYLPEYREYTWKQLMRMTHLEYFTSAGVAGMLSAGAEEMLPERVTEMMPGYPEGMLSERVTRTASDNLRNLADGNCAEMAPEHLVCGAEAQAASEGVWLLFDYGRRDPVTRGAFVQVVNMPL